MPTPAATYRVRQTPATSAPVRQVLGAPCRIGHPAFACFVHHTPKDGWAVSEDQTGFPVGRGGTRAAALASAKGVFRKLRRRVRPAPRQMSCLLSAPQSACRTDATFPEINRPEIGFGGVYHVLS